jgi:Na+-transporting methylmalonyl-CoA/oxaloacetate decarboxylase gamma subunit
MTLIYHNVHKLLLITLLLTGGLLAVPANAQNAVSLSVSPAIFDMNANPDQAWQSTLRVINNNSFDLTVYAEVVNFRPSGEGGTAQFIPIEEATASNATLAEWITVPATALVIPAEQMLEIPIEIDLPPDTPPGGHYAAVLVGTRPPADREDATRVETSQVVSSLIFLRVSGDIVEQGSIRGFRAINAVSEKPEVDFELRFENNGNVHLRPEGEIRIFNMWGQERGLIPVNQQTLFGNILSDSIRSFRFTWEGEWSPVDIGRYRAEATLAYGEDGRKFTDATATFWIIPWRILTGILLVLITIGVLLALLVKLYVRRMLALAGIKHDTPLQRQLATNRKPPVSVVAPIEAGMLDLRSRFADTRSNRLDSLFNFISEYKLFFLGVLVVLMVLYLLSWFIATVSQENRAYEVTINGNSERVVVDSESLQYQEQQTNSVVAKRDVAPVRLINRSGVNGVAAKVAVALEELGYTIDSVSTDLNVTETKTVVIHDPLLEDEALELSALLDNALLSAFTAPDTDNLILTVYVGTDLAE